MLSLENLRPACRSISSWGKSISFGAVWLGVGGIAAIFAFEDLAVPQLELMSAISYIGRLLWILFLVSVAAGIFYGCIQVLAWIVGLLGNYYPAPKIANVTGKLSSFTNDEIRIEVENREIFASANVQARLATAWQSPTERLRQRGGKSEFVILRFANGKPITGGIVSLHSKDGQFTAQIDLYGYAGKKLVRGRLAIRTEFDKTGFTNAVETINTTGKKNQNLKRKEYSNADRWKDRAFE